MSSDNSNFADPSYKEFVGKLNQRHTERLNQPISHPRFVKFEDRLDKTDFTEEQMKQVLKGRDLTQWRGVILLKDPYDYCIYQLMLQELKPATIIEIGTFNGGTALWMADMMKIHGLKTHVYTMDYEVSKAATIVKARDDITVIQGDSNKIEEAFPDDMLKGLPHPWLITDDAHVNITGVLGHFHKFTQPGDYMVAEDTHPFVSVRNGYGVLKDVPFVPAGTSWKYEPFKQFMKLHGEHYRVDTGYTDLFGYNATWMLNSILRRV